jgi:taurine--2-oxoglutarate transaminase
VNSGQSRRQFDRQEIVDLSREYTFFSWSVQGQADPIPVVKAQGAYFWDATGKRYLDFASQLVNANIGHQIPRVVAAIQQQAEQLTFVAPGLTTEVRALLGRKLAQIIPDLEDILHLGGRWRTRMPSRSRAYTGRYKTCAPSPNHGATYRAVALTAITAGCPRNRRCPALSISSILLLSLSFGDSRLATGSASRTWKRSFSTMDLTRLRRSFLSGVTGTNGLIIPPDDYWLRA